MTNQAWLRLLKTIIMQKQQMTINTKIQLSSRRRIYINMTEQTICNLLFKEYATFLTNQSPKYINQLCCKRQYSHEQQIKLIMSKQLIHTCELNGNNLLYLAGKIRNPQLFFNLLRKQNKSTSIQDNANIHLLRLANNNFLRINKDKQSYLDYQQFSNHFPEFLNQIEFFKIHQITRRDIFYVIDQTFHFTFNYMNSTKNGRSLSILNKARKWQKVVEPIVKYDRSRSHLGYPIDFFYELEKIVSGGHTLKLNIAATLTGAKDNYIRTAFRNNEQVGQLEFMGGIIKSTFDSDVEKETQQRINKLCERDLQFDLFYKSLKQNNASDQILPCILIKEKSIDQKIGEDGSSVTMVDYRVVTLSKDEYKKIINLEMNQIAQCFILGSGKQASIIRFFYFPGKQNSEAFKIDNVQGFMKRRFGKGQFKVREQSQNSLTFVKIMFINKSFYQQTLNMVQFLQRQMKISISKIVCDWVMDPFNRYYLIDLKEVFFQPKSDSIHPQRTLTETLAYLTCTVCQQKYCAAEITKTLTDKLIFQFFQHLKKRQIILSFTAVYRKSFNTSRVCDLCFMLIVSQSELMELERSVAKVTHSINDDQIKKINLHNQINKFGKMFEWRLFLYLEDIRNLIIQDFNSKINYYVIMRLHNSLASFKLKESATNYNLVKGIKIYYLFSEHDKIENFLVKSQIQIRITRGNNWNSVLAEGRTSGLYQESEKHSMRKFKQILVFNQKSKYSVIGMHIGIKLQGKSDPSSLPLSKYHDAFMVDGNYSNCYSLPAEWMETIDPSYCVNQLQPPSFKFQLHLGNNEKDKFLPILKDPKRKKLML